MKVEVFPLVEDRSLKCMDKLIYLLDQAQSESAQFQRQLADQAILLAERTKKLKSVCAENRLLRREKRKNMGMNLCKNPKS